jgi:murein DD-endopeptidase MepM/ murein hydrolase activator NlpD
MRKKITSQGVMRLARTATILSIGGLAAGCSSDVIRFSDGFYTGAIPQANEVSPQAATGYGQPNYDPNVDRGVTGSIASQPVQRMALPRPSEARLANPQPAGTVAPAATASAPLPAPASPNVSPMTTASIAPAEPGPSRFGGDAAPAKPVNRNSAAQRSAPAPQARPVAKNSPAREAVTAEGGRYTVVAGDTLSAISRRTGASVASIKQVNSMSGDTVRIGEKLIIPGLSAPEKKQVASAAKVDPVTTGTIRPQEGSQQPLAGYTPPKQAVSKTEGSITKIETQATAKAPDSTGVNAMRWPVQGRVVNAFGSNNGGKPNDGIDISVPTGTPVKVAENGVVIYAGDGLKELGKTVLVRHSDGVVTVYGHVSEIDVKRGDTVKRGQQIAASGMSGSAKQPQLHFEVRKNSKPVNPAKFLQ